MLTTDNYLVNKDNLIILIGILAHEFFHASGKMEKNVTYSLQKSTQNPNQKFITYEFFSNTRIGFTNVFPGKDDSKAIYVGALLEEIPAQLVQRKVVEKTIGEIGFYENITEMSEYMGGIVPYMVSELGKALIRLLDKINPQEDNFRLLVIAHGDDKEELKLRGLINTAMDDETYYDSLLLHQFGLLTTEKEMLATIAKKLDEISDQVLKI